MSSPSNPSSHKSTALAANAMVDEGGALAQPSKEESEAELEHVIQKRRQKGGMPTRGLAKGDKNAGM